MLGMKQWGVRGEGWRVLVESTDVPSVSLSLLTHPLLSGRGPAREGGGASLTHDLTSSHQRTAEVSVQ